MAVTKDKDTFKTISIESKYREFRRATAGGSAAGYGFAVLAVSFPAPLGLF
uniref:Uncharacterized protein n=1 Tax=uncultured Rhodospirillales bacterium HF4000_24M03 TaxID=710788 RepID=E0XW22_9PROT|nr:hypothetical protein [uncultured Rhodospirillales bacterium HF4000_24M03]